MSTDLDPRPFVHKFSKTHTERHEHIPEDSSVGWTFSPRPEYEQDPMQYDDYKAFDTALTSETADEPLSQEVPLARHQPVIARKVSAGVWGVFCDACSHDKGEYVYPCRMGVQGLWQDNPPEELIEVE